MATHVCRVQPAIAVAVRLLHPSGLSEIAGLTVHISRLQVDRNVEVTRQVVNDYIKGAVQPRLAFDIPSSWRLFMVSPASILSLIYNRCSGFVQVRMVLCC